MTGQVGKRLIEIGREPLFQFALIGIIVFLLFPGDAPTPEGQSGRSPVIQVDAPLVERLAAQFEATWYRAPTVEETAGLIESYVREEVLYREALALGLDTGDAVIRQRMRLKMEFISEAAVAAITPDEAELAAWYAENASAFTSPATVGFQQVMLGDPSEADTVLASLADGADPASLGRGTLLPGQVDRGSELAVDGAFGPGFFDLTVALPAGEWAGPIESAYGWHLVRLETLDSPAAPPLDTVRDAVVAAWRQEQANALRESQYQAMRAQYDVRLPEAAE